MTGINLRVATLKNAKLKNCNLRGATLAGTDLEVRSKGDCPDNGCLPRTLCTLEMGVVCTVEQNS